MKKIIAVLLAGIAVFGLMIFAIDGGNVSATPSTVDGNTAWGYVTAVGIITLISAVAIGLLLLVARAFGKIEIKPKPHYCCQNQDILNDMFDGFDSHKQLNLTDEIYGYYRGD